MSAGAYFAIGLFLGALLGLLVGWWTGRNKPARWDTRLEEELRQQIAQRERELGDCRAQLLKAEKAKVAADTHHAAAERFWGSSTPGEKE